MNLGSKLIVFLERVYEFIEGHPRLFMLLVPLIKYFIKGVKYLYAQPKIKRRKILLGGTCCVLISLVCAFVVYRIITQETRTKLTKPSAIALENNIDDNDDGKYITFRSCNGTKITIDTTLVINNELYIGDVYKLKPAQPCQDHECDEIISVPAGCTLKVRLIDNSTVCLNAGSSLHISCGYGMQHRNLKLEGEGVFYVAKNGQLPFKVYLDNKIITALSTAFVVRGYSDLNYIEVAVISGKVKVEDTYQKVYLEKDKCTKISRDNSRWSVRKFDSLLTLGWLQGKYFMKNRSIGEACGEARRCFNESIIIDDPWIVEKDCFGMFDKNKPIEVFLEYLKMTQGINYEKRNGEWHLYQHQTTDIPLQKP